MRYLILTYYKKGDEEQLIGNWKTARKTDNCGTGKTTLSRKIIPVVANKEKPQPPKKTEPKTTPAPPVKNETDAPDKTQADRNNQSPVEQKPETQPKLEKRENKIFETITLDAENIEVSLFDNAEIDGDIITLLFNGEVVLSKQTLSDNPITVKLQLIRGKENVLTMYAENQGRIPPNTAIMRIKNEDNYHKILLSADDKKNGSVILKLK